MSVGSVGPSKIGSRKRGDLGARGLVVGEEVGPDDGSAARTIDGSAAVASAIDVVFKKFRRSTSGFIGASASPSPMSTWERGQIHGRVVAGAVVVASATSSRT